MSVGSRPFHRIDHHHRYGGAPRFDQLSPARRVGVNYRGAAAPRLALLSFSASSQPTILAASRKAA